MVRPSGRGIGCARLANVNVCAVMFICGSAATCTSLGVGGWGGVLKPSSPRSPFLRKSSQAGNFRTSPPHAQVLLWLKVPGCYM